MKLKTIIACIITIGFVMLPNELGYAQNEISISPPSQDIELVDNQKIIINVKNNYTFDVNLEVQIYGGRISDYLQTKPSDNLLIPNVVFADKNLLITAASQANFSAILTNTAQIVSGQYYLTVVFKNSTTAANQVAITSELPAEVKLIKYGSEKPALNMTINKFPKLSFTRPDKISYQLINDTSFDANPSGYIAIVDPNNQAFLAKTIINNNQQVVSAKAKQTYEQSFSTDNSAWKPGKYLISSQYRFNSNGEYRSFNQSFYYIPLWLIVTATLILVSTCLLILIMTKKIIHKTKNRNVSNSAKLM